jgi:benzoate membrane transport protein
MSKQKDSSQLTLLDRIQNDMSLSALVVGLIAVTTSYAGPLLIVFQAAKAANLSYPLLSTWIWAISFGSGLTGIILSAWFKTPVITAWSTPGAVLLVTALTTYAYAEAIGAYIFSALLIVFFGFSGLFSWVMKRIPDSVTTAMLAGILLKFGVDVFVSLKQLPLLVFPMVLCYLFLKRWYPRYSVAVTLLVGVLTASVLNLLDFSGVSIALVSPVFTKPVFSLNAIVGLGIPLFIVTMASQNAPGLSVLKADGYDVPASPLIATTGVASLILAPFGVHGINLAAITAAICTGEEAHKERNKRYVAGIACGVFYLLFGAFGATIVSVFSAFPNELIAVTAGLALFASLGSSLSLAMGEGSQKESALITFLVTVSNISIAGIGSPFWGLVAGMITNYIFTGLKKAD